MPFCLCSECFAEGKLVSASYVVEVFGEDLGTFMFRKNLCTVHKMDFKGGKWYYIYTLKNGISPDLGTPVERRYGNETWKRK